MNYLQLGYLEKRALYLDPEGMVLPRRRSDYSDLITDSTATERQRARAINFQKAKERVETGQIGQLIGATLGGSLGGGLGYLARDLIPAKYEVPAIAASIFAGGHMGEVLGSDIAKKYFTDVPPHSEMPEFMGENYLKSQIVPHIGLAALLGGGAGLLTKQFMR